MSKKTKKKTTSKNSQLRKELEKTIDINTGLNHAQLKAARLLALGTTKVKTARILGYSVNTIYYWQRENIAFKRAIETEKRKLGQKVELAVTPLNEFSLSAVDARFAQLLAPAIEAINDVLSNPEASDMARINASKYVCTRIYERLTQDEKMQSHNVQDLRDALKLIQD